MMKPEIFREYDIRGVYGRDFDDRFAFDLGRAFVTYLKNERRIENPKITLGHDARLSSPALSRAMCDGLKASGAHVIRLGLITTPISYYSTFHLNVDGAFMITGSHNPPDYNGYKISAGSSTIFGDEIQKLKKIVEAEDYLTGKGSEEELDIFPDYIERYRKEFSGLAALPVVLDCGNGAAGCIARRLYEACGQNPTILFEEPDGRFPNHHPDPTVEENLPAMKAAVKKHGAKIGIGFDGDADRIGVIDHNGRFILGDEMMVLLSRSILKTKPGAKIIGDVKCSDRLYDDIAKHGGQPVMWKTGHSLIKTKIKEEKSPFGGELSGHIFFADRNYGYDDALYAGLRLVEILSKTGKTIPELLEGLPSSYNTPEIRIDTTEEKKWAIVKKLQSLYNQDTANYKVNMIDGVRVSYKDGWALARASNTQPVLVLRFEADSAEALKRIQTEFENIVKPML